MQHVTEATLVASTSTEFEGYCQQKRDPFDRAEMAAKAFLARYRVKATRNTYGIAVRQWFEWCRENNVDPLEPGRAPLEFFARELETTGRKPETVAHKLNVIGMFFKVCLMDEIITRDPMIHVKRPTVERVSRSTLFSRGEVVDMIAAAEAAGPQDHALIAILAHHGMRIGETLAIDIEHLVESRGQMAVSITRKGGKHQLITFAPEVAWIVKRLLEKRGETGALFLTRTGRRMDRKAAGLVVKRIAKAAGVTKRAHPHAFRKSMATISRNNGIPDREIIAACGWASGGIMLEYYDGGKESLQTNAGLQLAAVYDRAS